MKFIHCADLHLDSKMETNLSKEQAAERREEIYQTFIDMIQYGKKQQVKGIIIAGDLFDNGNNVQIRLKRRILEEIKNTEDIDFLYLKGNHDKDNFFENLEEKPENLKLFDNNWTLFEYEEVRIYGCQEIWENENYNLLSLEPESINLVVLHGQETINLSLLEHRYIDYLALGHIHSYKSTPLDERGMYCYSGCLEGRGFDECGEKGFVLLEIEEHKIAHHFVPFAKRNFHEIKVTLTGDMSEGMIKEAIEKKILGIPPKDLVKIILVGEVEEETDIDLRYLWHQYKEHFYFLKIYDQTELKIRFEQYEKDISLKGEFVRLVMAEKLPEEEKNKIIMMGLRALADREIELC